MIYNTERYELGELVFMHRVHLDARLEKAFPPFEEVGRKGRKLAQLSGYRAVRRLEPLAMKSEAAV
jgi:hypothetical protein